MRENSKLYVPVSQAYLVSRYIGTSEEIPSLHTLGTKNWQKTKANAQKAIIGYAQDLLRMSAERIVQGGFTFSSRHTRDGRILKQIFPTQKRKISSAPSLTSKKT